jgi:TolB-like protein
MKTIVQPLLAILSLGLWAQESANQPVVSVLYFENLSSSEEFSWVSRGVADLLVSELGGNDIIQIVEREDLDKVLEEQELALSGFFEGDPLEVGALLRANYLVTGSFALSGDTLRLDAKIMNVDSGAVEISHGLDGPVSGIFGIQKNLALVFRTWFGIESPSETVEIAYEAVRRYYEGLEFLEEGEMQKALEAFKEAQQFEPLYDKPAQGIETAYEFLRDFRNLRKQREINELYVKAAELDARLRDTEWKTLADIYMEAYAEGWDAQEYLEENPSHFYCDEPAICLWNLQMTLMEIGDKSAEYFEDEATQEAMYLRVLDMTEQARVTFAEDEWLPEILYMNMLAIRHLGRWQELKDACEEMFLEYSDMRMMWAIEGMYETALENLGG